MQDGRGGIDFKCLCTSENIRRKSLYSKEDECVLTAQFISVGFRSAKPRNVQTFIGTPGKRLAKMRWQ